MECGYITCGKTPDLYDKVRVHFAEASFSEFTRRRYGMKDCVNSQDFMYLLDLVYIYKRSLDLKDCDPEGVLDSCLGCDMPTIEETIKTL